MVTPEMKSLKTGFLLLLSSQLFACGGQMVGWTTPDDISPQIATVTPADQATNVELNSPFTATFTEVMDASTITGVTFLADRGATPIAGNVMYVGVTGVFSPKFNLLPNTEYTATVTTGAKDPAGNALADDYQWTFSTGAALDLTAPHVTNTNPGDDETGVSVNTAIIASFSEEMDPNSMTEATFRVNNGIVAILGSVTQIGATAIFRLDGDLEFDTEYTATIDQDASDLAGNSMAEDYVWTFTTSAFSDDIAPTVVLTDPEDGDIAVPRNTMVSAQFSEPMDPLTLTTANFIVTGPGITPVSGTVDPDVLGLSAAFTPNADLLPNTLFTATITTGAEDLAGNSLAQDYVWTFTTGNGPSVILTDPEDQDIDVSVQATLSAMFSEPMEPSDLNNSTFLLEGPAPLFSPVSGVVTHDALSIVAYFEPDNDLLSNTEYTATITTGAQNPAGIGLDQDYVWTFTTETGPAFLPPPIDLGSLESFVAVAGVSIDNLAVSYLNGDVGISPGSTCTGCIPPDMFILGSLHVANGVAQQAKVDLTAALVQAQALPPASAAPFVVSANMAGQVLAPGVYTSNSTMLIDGPLPVTLDAQGDPNAWWVFQVGSSLTVTTGSSVLLINGARATNVFWAVGSSSTLGANVTFYGSVLAQASNTVGTDSVVTGRLLCTSGSITLLSNYITLPLP